jgi:hypothetical protein
MAENENQQYMQNFWDRWHFNNEIIKTNESLSQKFCMYCWFSFSAILFLFNMSVVFSYIVPTSVCVCVCVCVLKKGEVLEVDCYFFWAHKTSSTPPILFEVFIPSKEGEWSYICVLGIYNLPLRI